jgi:hypothetical protein
MKYLCYTSVWSICCIADNYCYSRLIICLSKAGTGLNAFTALPFPTSFWVEIICRGGRSDVRIPSFLWCLNTLFILWPLSINLWRENKCTSIGCPSGRFYTGPIPIDLAHREEALMYEIYFHPFFFFSFLLCQTPRLRGASSARFRVSHSSLASRLLKPHLLFGGDKQLQLVEWFDPH